MKKSILFIQHNLAGGGAEKVLIDILNNFDYSRFDVTLLLIRKEGVYVKAVPSQVKLRWIYDPEKRPCRLIYNRFTIKQWPKWRLFTQAAYRKYDTVVSFMEGSAVRFHAMMMSRAKRNISWVHCDLKAMHWTPGFFQHPEDEFNAYKRMDEVVHVSKSAAAAFNELFNYEFPTRVIYNLIDRPLIIKRSKEPCPVEKQHKITLCNVGRLTPPKKQDRLIRVAEKLMNQYGLDVEVWILGQGELREELGALADDLKVSNIVHFLGFQSNPYAFVRAADAFVLTSYTEGFPLVVAEALCIGKPTISTNVTGPNEMLADGAGILTSEDVDDIARQIYELFTVPGRYEHYCQQATLRSQMFQPERTMNEVYSAILGPKNS